MEGIYSNILARIIDVVVTQCTTAATHNSEDLCNANS